ncbi:hypothetical protein [Candidatus Palauibacter sp.]|uniref:hypothetical protein n=1 Tax=Candidatus Palauibacter sp. TaxID=3101350 RepID=UPI003B017C51
MRFVAVALLAVLTACAKGMFDESAQQKQDVTYQLAQVPVIGGPVENPPSAPLADVKELPGWSEVVDKIEFGQCAVYWRRSRGEYGLSVTKLEYSEAALEAKREAVQVATYLRPVGSDGETRIAARAICLLPNGVTALEELKGYLTGIFPPAPKEEEDAQARLDQEGPCARHLGNPDPCPEIVVTGHPTPTCQLGFDWDEWSGECVPNFVGEGTTAPGGAPGGGSPGSSTGGPNENEEGEEEEPACTDDQTAIAAEYNDPDNWPCTTFTHLVTTHGKRGDPNIGVHKHDTGYLSQGFYSGASDVFVYVELRGLTGAGIESDWRCPVGNADPRVGGSAGSQHVLGTAGDFYSADFDARAAGIFSDAAELLADWWYSDTAHTHIDWRDRP